MRFLIPFCPVAFYLERDDDLGPFYGVTFSRADGLQMHWGDWTFVAATN